MYDRDLDVPSRPSIEPTEPVAPYRRMVVNPLLAVTSFVAAILFMRAALGRRDLPSFLASIGWMGLSMLLIQVHCLDCGRTDWLLSSRRHACPAVLERWRAGRRARWSFPRTGTQVTLWFYVLASVATLVLILGYMSR